jgi:hypothetical protein
MDDPTDDPLPKPAPAKEKKPRQPRKKKVKPSNPVVIKTGPVVLTFD